MPRRNHTLNIPWVTLSNSERDAFTAAVQSIKLSPYTYYKQLLRPLGEIFKQTISQQVYKELQRIAQDSLIHGILLRNCPVNPTPGPTPDDDKSCPQKGFLEEFFLIAKAAVQNSTPYHDKEEKHGEVFSQVITIKGREQELSSRGLGFPWHTEHIHLEKTIDWIDLFGVKGDKNAFTGIFSAEGLMKDLPTWVFAQLQQPIFKMQTGPSWPAHLKMSHIQPILEQSPNGYFTIRLNTDFENRLLGTTDDAKQALQYLTKHLQTIDQEEFCISPGDCLTVNNKRAVHQRRVFTPSTSHEDRRWLIGLYRMNV